MRPWQLCEDGECGAALLLDAHNPRRLCMWAANCMNGPSVAFQVVNVHTVAELNLEVRRVSGARSMLVFDQAFSRSAELRVVKALLTRTLAVPRKGGAKEQPARHVVSCSWLDGRVWLRVYRIETDATGALDLAEIGPRLVLLPTRIMASVFGGAVLHES